MNLSELKLELKALIAKFSTPAKMAEYKTKDGKVFSVDGELSIGASASIDGNPAADGDYALEDGTFYVVKEGKIIDMKKAEVENKPEEVKVEDIASLISKIVDEKISALTSEFGKKMEDFKTTLTGEFTKLGEENKAIKEATEKHGTFAKDVMLLLEKLPDAEVKKPKDKAHKQTPNDLEKFRKQYM